MGTVEPFAYVPLISILRTLAIVLVVMLAMVYAVIKVGRKKQDRMEHKLDMIGGKLGLREAFAALDGNTKRDTALAPLEDEIDSGWEGGTHKKRHWYSPSPGGVKNTPPPPASMGGRNYSPPPPPPPRPPK